MKLKHYFHQLQSQIRDSEAELEDLMCKQLINKIMTCYGEECSATTLPTVNTPVSDFYDMFLGCNGHTILLPYLLQNLCVGEDDYIKYYFLDSLTNQGYTDLLINNVCQLYDKGVSFIFDFSLKDFLTKVDEPSITVEYVIRDKEIFLTAIVYSHPFNGDMEMSDFMSILIDSLYLLNPEKVMQYLTLKLANNVSVIGYSASKAIHLYPNCTHENLDFEDSIVNQYRVNGCEINLQDVNPLIKMPNSKLVGEMMESEKVKRIVLNNLYSQLK